jgi:hypothetical protein
MPLLSLSEWTVLYRRIPSSVAMIYTDPHNPLHIIDRSFWIYEWTPKNRCSFRSIQVRVHGMPPPCFCCERKTFSPASNTGFSNVSSPSPPPPPAPPLASAASFSSINER